jgi:hypothetical protein
MYKRMNTTGTMLMGYFPEGTKYSDLKKVFGKPDLEGSPDGKAQARWFGKVYDSDDLKFTIYDYKSSVKHTKNTDWHIGGNNKMVVELVVTYFKNNLK